MPKDKSIHKVLVIGSGPIVIGQAAEFDYAGAQACRVLRQEGITTVLVNSNPATIMTDKNLADAIYLEPLTAETVRRIIDKERPDGLLAGLGGQTGLTIAMQLSRDGTLEKYGVRHYFDEITLSSIVGYRKPHPNIFRIACAQANLDPSECAFVGDTLSRDVVGPRRMGFGRVFKINSFLTPQKDLGRYDVAPDYQITDIYDVYTILKQERDNA